jgi:uncharacterized protein
MMLFECESTVPYLWFSEDTNYLNNSGDCDCNCAFTVHAVDMWYSQCNSELENGLLRHGRPLHVAMCDEERWLVRNPTGTGYIAVLNRPAMHLFKQFQSPVTVNRVRQWLVGWPPEMVDATAAQFLRSGILENVNKPAFRQQWGPAQTLTAWLHVTNECNLRCPYCYLHKTDEPMLPETGRRTVDAILRSAVAHQFSCVRFKYAGGEASMRLPNLLALHDYASEQATAHGIALEAVMLSNGVALSHRMIAELQTRQIEVMISLDGVGDAHDAQRVFINGHGSFGHVERSLDRLQAAGVVPHISVTVTARNIAGLPELMAYLLARDLPFSLNYYRDNDCAAPATDLRYDEARMIDGMRAAFAVIEANLPRRSLLGCLVDRASLSALHNRTCGVGQNYLVIDQFGRVAKCQMEITRPVTTVAADDPLRLVQQDRKGIQNLPVDEKEGCRDCQWRYWCAGGCPLLTYRATGRYDVRSPNCHIYQALYPEVLRLEGLRLLRYEAPWEPEEKGM